MMQFSYPLPDDVPNCSAGHRPQLVETRGAPLGHPIGEPCPTSWHIECGRCRIATVPTYSRAIAESRWRWHEPLRLIPLSDLGRERAALATTNAA